MGRQVIVSIEYEHGCFGYAVAKCVSENLGIAMYDYNTLKEIAGKEGMDAKALEKYYGVPRIRLFSKRRKGGRDPAREQIFGLLGKYLRERADQGESFVAVDWCAEGIFKDEERLAAIFISGDIDRKTEHVSEVYGLPLPGSQKMIYQRDKKRKAYYNYYSGRKWGAHRVMTCS